VQHKILIEAPDPYGISDRGVNAESIDGNATTLHVIPLENLHCIMAGH
jgi:hypothetical protein